MNGPAALKHLWSKPWVRRLTWTLAAGAVLVQGTAWWLGRPATTAWVVGKLDALSRERTGLGLSIRRIRVGPWSGYLLLEDVAWGGDLLRVRRIEVQADPWSLLTRRPHLLNLRLVEPEARISESRLAAFRLNLPPKSDEAPAKLLLDHFSLVNGKVVVEQPTRGLPALAASLDAQGKGLGPNALALDLRSALDLGPTGKGKLVLGADLSEPLITFRGLSLELGPSRLKAVGRLEPKRPAADLRLAGRVDLAQASTLAPGLRARGAVDFDARLGGPLDHPQWTLQLHAEGLDPGLPDLAPGDLSLSAHGEDQTAVLKSLQWASADGAATLEGTWHRTRGLQARIETKDLDLRRAGNFLRVPQMALPRFSFEGEVALAGRPEQWTSPARWTFKAAGKAQDVAGSAGSFEAAWNQGQGRAALQTLRLGDMTLDGQAQASVDPRGALRLKAEGEASLEVGSVAQTLAAWHLVNLPMSGLARGRASLTFTPEEGLLLDGEADIARPAWQQETADLISGRVRIRKDQLWVDDIRLEAHGGQGTGSLWLTWGEVPKGQPQMISCYTASHMPVEAGLRAAGLTDEDLGVSLRGLGSGWVELSGPYRALRLTGGGRVEGGSVAALPGPTGASAFKVALPAGEGGLDFDLATLRLRLTDLHLAGEAAQLQGIPGPLDLRGHLDLDLERGVGWGRLSGLVDTEALAWPGPRVTAKIEAGLEGPLSEAFGPLRLPRGWVRILNGGVEVGDFSVGGFQGGAELKGSAFSLALSHRSRKEPLLDLSALSEGGALRGGGRLRFLPATLDTSELSKRLTGGALTDLRVDLEAKGRWDGHTVGWQGRFHDLVGLFPAFTLGQARSTEVWGDGSGARLDLALEGHQRGTLSPEGTPLPGASVHLGGTLPFSAAAPLDLRATGTMEMSALKAVADALLDVEEGSLVKEIRPQGFGTFDLRGRGTYLQPFVDGAIDMTGARLHIGDLDEVRDLDLHLRFKDRTVSLAPDRPLQGTLNQGRVQASGELQWKPGGLDRYAFRGRLDNFQTQDPPGMEGLLARGSAEATLTGNAEGGVIRGRIEAETLAYRTDIRLTELLYQSALADTGARLASGPDDPLDAIRLDLDLVMTRPWEIDTNLARLEGSPEGAFKIQGTLAHPGLRGRMALASGGRITNLLPAGDVVLNRGTVDFSDPSTINPRLDLEGEVQVPGYTVTMGITGTLASLDWNLRSVPSLSRNDIVAVLINPDYAQNIGSGPSLGSQTAVSTGAANAGTGLLTTLALAELQERLRKTFGLDRFNVAFRSGTQGSAETDFTGAKRVNLLGWRFPLVVHHKRSRDLVSTNAQIEWRFGGFILQLGGSQTTDSPFSPSGEIRKTWSPKR